MGDIICKNVGINNKANKTLNFKINKVHVTFEDVNTTKQSS